MEITQGNHSEKLKHWCSWGFLRSSDNIKSLNQTPLIVGYGSCDLQIIIILNPNLLKIIIILCPEIIHRRGDRQSKENVECKLWYSEYHLITLGNNNL